MKCEDVVAELMGAVYRMLFTLDNRSEIRHRMDLITEDEREDLRRVFELGKRFLEKGTMVRAEDIERSFKKFNKR